MLHKWFHIYNINTYNSSTCFLFDIFLNFIHRYSWFCFIYFSCCTVCCCINIPQFIHSPVDKYWGCFQFFFAVMNILSPWTFKEELSDMCHKYLPQACLKSAIFFFRVYVFVSCLTHSSLFQYHKDSLLHFLLVVLLYAFSSLAHLKLTFVHGIRQDLTLSFCHLDYQLSQYNLLNGSSFRLLICKGTTVVQYVFIYG